MKLTFKQCDESVKKKLQSRKNTQMIPSIYNWYNTTKKHNKTFIYKYINNKNWKKTLKIHKNMYSKIVIYKDIYYK